MTTQERCWCGHHKRYHGGGSCTFCERRQVELITGDGIGTDFYSRDARRRVPTAETDQEKRRREYNERRDKDES